MLRAVRSALVLIGLFAGAYSTPALAQDRVTHPARGLRYLRRAVHRGALRTTVHALYVDLCDPSIELRATAPGEGGRTPATWARLVGAAAAINGDYFDVAGGVAPTGPARGAGRAWPEGRREHHDAVFVAGPGGRAAVLDTTTGGAPALWADASRAVPAAWTELVAVRERVLMHGVVRESAAIAHDGDRHPRTALGLTADGHTLIMVVVEGRAEDASGATVRELGEILAALGAWEGMKLDGGGSSAMFIARAGTVNRPSDGAARAVATHLGVVVRRDAPAPTPPRCADRPR
jgi:hypothetical protein